MPSTRTTADRADERVDALASRALKLVAARPGRPQRTLNPMLLSMMYAGAISGDRDALDDAVMRMVDSGLTLEEIADVYVPALARHMGEMWVEDRLSCTGVSIGTSRLQLLVREIGSEWKADRVMDPDAPSLLILVARNADHTLGAAVLAGQLRRKGLSVRLIFGAHPEEVAQLMRQIRFDAVMISSSLGESLETVRQLVDAVKTALVRTPPVVLGGTILDTEDETTASIQAQTGADHITSDPVEALRLCGLTTITRSGEHGPRT